MGKSKELAELGDVVTQDGGNMLVGTTGHFNYSGGTTEITVGTDGTGSSAGGAITFVSNNGATTLGYAGFQESETQIGTMGSRPLKLTTDNTARLTIDASGRVTTPYQPFIECTGNTGSAYLYSAGSVVSHWSDRTTAVGITRSGGRFTVPVAGKYYFGFTLYSYVTSSGHYRIHIAINGSNHSLTQLEISSGAMIDSQYDHTLMYSNILNLSANDYVEIKVNDQQQIYRGTPHNSLSMMLIG